LRLGLRRARERNGDIWIVTVPPSPLDEPYDRVAALAAGHLEAAVMDHDRCSGNRATT
jgi:hypothetical protein